MAPRPSVLWKQLPLDTRLAAADAFWRDLEGDEAAEIHHAEAVVAIARKLNFRAKSVRALPVERRAKQLAHLADVSDTVAARALIAYHMAARRPMMGAFLDAVGIAHENGVITADEVQAPPEDRLAAGIRALDGAYPADEVALYLSTLVAVDEDTWGGLDAARQASS